MNQKLEEFGKENLKSEQYSQVGLIRLVIYYKVITAIFVIAAIINLNLSIYIATPILLFTVISFIYEGIMYKVAKRESRLSKYQSKKS